MLHFPYSISIQESLYVTYIEIISMLQKISTNHLIIKHAQKEASNILFNKKKNQSKNTY
jgi:hypothetical protein